MKAWRYTYQTLSDSGSFAAPAGDNVHHCRAIVQLKAAFEDWARVHRRVGAPDDCAVVRVWIGNLVDVTDVYPDFDLMRGPRGGVQRVPL